MTSFYSSSSLKIRGLFENFVNMNCSPTDSDEARDVMRVVSDIAHDMGMTCSWAGSRKKKTYVDGYSDADIWVETYKKVVTDDQRDEFAQRVYDELQNQGYTNVDYPDYKPVATSFYCDKISFDVVFSKSQWAANNNRIIPPDNSAFCKIS